MIMWQKDLCGAAQSIGVKKYMSIEGVIKGLKYEKHKPGIKIKENSIRYWVDYLD